MVRERCDAATQVFAANLESVFFDACMHGGSRDKRTKLWCSPGLFSNLAADCDQGHTHSPWTPFWQDGQSQFPTATEAEYPPLLSNRMAECLREHISSWDLHFDTDPKLKHLLQMSLGTQSLKHKPLIPEFRSFVHPTSLPSHKLLASPPTGALSADSPSLSNPRKKLRSTYKYGEWWDPKEFLEQGKKLCHPVDDKSFLEEVTRDAIDAVTSADPVALAKIRLREVLNVRKLVSNLADQEASLKSKMHPQVASLLQQKNIVLFEHLLRQVGYDDMEVVNLLVEGVPLVGCQDAPKGFRKHLVPAVSTQLELESSAIWRRRAIMGKHRNSSAEDIKELLATTNSEVEAGFLKGPFSEQEMSDHLGTENWVLNPRFVIYQGASRKVRVIDDARVSF